MSFRPNAREALLLLVLAAVQFTHIVDFMIIMPLGPTYLREMRLQPEEFGRVVGAYNVSAGIMSLLAARFLDRFGRKPVLLVLYAGFTAGTLLCAVAPDYPLLLAARTVAGAFGGVVAAVVMAIVGDAFPDARRGTATGIIMSAFSVASIAGVPLGLYLAEELGWNAPFTVLAGLSALVLLIAAGVLPPLRGHLGQVHAAPTSTWAVLTDPDHLRAFGLTVALVLSTFTLVPHLATYLVVNAGLAQPELKFMYLCGGLATLVTLTFFGRLADRLGKLRVFRALALFTLIPILLITNLPAGLPLAAVLALTTIFMISTSGRMVPAMALITASSAPRYRGSFMSLNTAVQHVASGLGAYLAGTLLTQPDGEQGPLVGYPLVGVISCLATVTSVVLAGHLRPAPDDRAPDRAELGSVPPEAIAAGEELL